MTIQEMPGKVGFGRAIGNFFKGYADFRGRTTRAGFWWAVLFQGLVYTVAAVFAGFLVILGLVSSKIFMLLGAFILGLVFLGLLLPTFALLMRRLRDVGLSLSANITAISAFGVILLLQPVGLVLAAPLLNFILFLLLFAFAVAFFAGSLVASKR
ncbi:MAG: DUF805 domain-containing protein [Streptococcaceae bacterium]|jgi:uncharacterized membrane protein YhaH (DUF805 family)|nr:DUF805 domain-containing protein [Streptococcaceae bacterium]